MDVLHTAIWVDDLDAQLGFYETVLNLPKTREFVGDDGARNTYVGGESGVELQFKSFDEGTAHTASEPAGIDHIAVAVEDVDATVVAAREDWDSRVQRGPETLEEKGLRIAFVTDPSGYVVELIESLEAT